MKKKICFLFVLLSGFSAVSSQNAFCEKLTKQENTLLNSVLKANKLNGRKMNVVKKLLKDDFQAFLKKNGGTLDPKVLIAAVTKKDKAADIVDAINKKIAEELKRIEDAEKAKAIPELLKAVADKHDINLQEASASRLIAGEIKALKKDVDLLSEKINKAVATDPKIENEILKNSGVPTSSEICQLPEEVRGKVIEGGTAVVDSLKKEAKATQETLSDSYEPVQDRVASLIELKKLNLKENKSAEEKKKISALSINLKKTQEEKEATDTLQALEAVQKSFTSPTEAKPKHKFFTTEEETEEA